MAQHGSPPHVPGAPDTGPLTTTKSDATHGFNRADYLRVRPPTDPDCTRIYGMRADNESLNAHLERAFTTGACPAWGLHNQTVMVPLATPAQNAWARLTWRSAPWTDRPLHRATPPDHRHPLRRPASTKAPSARPDMLPAAATTPGRPKIGAFATP